MFDLTGNLTGAFGGAIAGVAMLAVIWAVTFAFAKSPARESVKIPQKGAQTVYRYSQTGRMVKVIDLDTADEVYLTARESNRQSLADRKAEARKIAAKARKTGNSRLN